MRRGVEPRRFGRLDVSDVVAPGPSGILHVTFRTEKAQLCLRADLNSVHEQGPHSRAKSSLEIVLFTNKLFTNRLLQASEQCFGENTDFRAHFPCYFSKSWLLDAED